MIPAATIFKLFKCFEVKTLPLWVEQIKSLENKGMKPELIGALKGAIRNYRKLLGLNILKQSPAL